MAKCFFATLLFVSIMVFVWSGVMSEVHLEDLSYVGYGMSAFLIGMISLVGFISED